jgi:polyhydroxybutyrate depolymerase
MNKKLTSLLTLMTILLSTGFSFSSKTMNVTLSSDNVLRDGAQLIAPKNFETKEKWPLIISLHGYTGSSKVQKQYVKLHKYVNKKGYMLLIPNGQKNSADKRFWNASQFCCDFENTKVDDVAYIKGLLKRIDNNPLYPNIDHSRIFLVGHSNGAFFTHKLACREDFPVAGIVTLSGTSDKRDAEGNLLETKRAACKHGQSIPHLHVHGTDDKTIGYNGFDNLETKKGFLSVDEFMENWSIQNKCQDKALKQRFYNTDLLTLGHESKVFEWKACESKLELIKVNRAGHFILYKKRMVRTILKFFGF